jgi:hypothetical protein
MGRKASESAAPSATPKARPLRLRLHRLITDKPTKPSSLSSAESRSAHLPFSAVFQSMRGFATCHMALRQQRNESSCSSMNVIPKVGVPCHRAPLGV